MNLMNPVCYKSQKCKCCNAEALLFDVVDFNKNCNVSQENLLPVSGVPVYYYRCKNCEFIFTSFFDEFNSEDFSRYVYNEDYILVDPDYLEKRPFNNANFLVQLLRNYKTMDIFDYGGGNGKLAEKMKELGHLNVQTYDPFSEKYSVKPDKKFDCVVSFEVVEHSPNPKDTFKEMISFMKPDGFLIFSTLITDVNIQTVIPDESQFFKLEDITSNSDANFLSQSSKSIVLSERSFPSEELDLFSTQMSETPEGIPDIQKNKCNWWYVGPRNGHVSLHSSKSLSLIAQLNKLNCYSFNQSLHLICHTVPEFLKPSSQSKV